MFNGTSCKRRNKKQIFYVYERVEKRLFRSYFQRLISSHRDAKRRFLSLGKLNFKYLANYSETEIELIIIFTL